MGQRVNKLPASEDGHGIYWKTDYGNFLVTYNTKKDKFTLWKELSDGYEKLNTADNPFSLYKKIQNNT